MPVNEFDEYLFEKRQKLKTKQQTKFFTNKRKNLKFGEVLINVDFKGKKFASQKFELGKDIRIIILYPVPISLWPSLGKENRYFYASHPYTNDRWS